MEDPQRGSDLELVERIRDEILAAPERRITFARFMERALTEPGLGYYAVSDRRPTRGGDFLTAPELHPFFGRLIARQLDEVWRRLGAPSQLTVREYGAGRGTLEGQARAGLVADRSPLADVIAWEPIDLGSPEPTQPIVGAILANEYLDALPLHRVVRRGDSLLERFVVWRDERFTEEEGVPSQPGLAEVLAADGITLAEGQLAEVSLAGPAWIARAAAALDRGLVLVIDYGHPAAELYGPRRMAGTLMTYRGHRAGDDPFSFVGRQDITAHVDVTALERAATAAGLDLLGATSQARFLASLGLGDLLSDLGRQPGKVPAAYLLARAAVARFLDPLHLGAFRVLAWGRGISAEPPLRGFSGEAR